MVPTTMSSYRMPSGPNGGGDEVYGVYQYNYPSDRSAVDLVQYLRWPFVMVSGNYLPHVWEPRFVTFLYRTSTQL